MISTSPSCPQCGAPLQPHDRFCGQCRAPVGMQAGPPLYEKRRSSCMRTVLIIIAALTALAIVGQIGHIANPTGAPSAPAAPAGHQVTYKVYGATSKASFTWRNAQGGTQQYDATPLPWEITYNMASGAFAYISAQNAYAGGAVTCDIDVDGVQVKTTESIGAYVIATCSGRVP